MIHFYTIGNRNVASSRMRVWFVSEALKDTYGYDVSVDVVRPLRYWYELRKDRLKDFFGICKNLLSKGAILYVHKVVAPPECVLVYVFGARVLKRRVIFDFDDTISGRWAHMLLRHATHVVVSSHALLEHAQTYNDHVTLIPTTIPEWLYTPSDKSHEVVRIGWIGAGKSHLENLKWFAPILNVLRERKAHARFVCIGAQGISEIHELFKGEEIIDELEWGDETEIVKALQNIDIGIMPLLDTDRFRGKAAFKLIQYMALGIPVVASPVGENIHVVRDGHNGFLASTHKEWADKLEMLIRDASQRKTLGRHAQETVHKGYTLESQLPRYRELIGGEGEKHEME